MAYLEGKNLVASYGVVPILHECSVEVEKGELAVIVGPNGAGKSTVMRVLLGMLEATSGSVMLDGKDISMLSTQDRISHGLAFVPQTKNVFPSMTVEENLQMGGFIRQDDINQTIEEVYALFPILYDKAQTTCRATIWWPKTTGCIWKSYDDETFNYALRRANCWSFTNSDG